VLVTRQNKSPGKEADRWNLLLLFSISYSNLLPFSRRQRFRPFYRWSVAGFFPSGTAMLPMSSSPAATWATGIGGRFHRFFSHAAWDLDVLSMHLAKWVVIVLTLGGTLLWAVDDTLCRKRGLTLYGGGMHHDPLISSRAKPLVSWATTGS